MNSPLVDVSRFHTQGFLKGLPVFSPEEAKGLMDVYWRLRKLLPPGAATEGMDWWHARDRQLWEICTNPTILDYVETILGPDFYLWGSQFFSKDPGEGKTVPWHQDAFYWPLRPHKTVTAWLAFADTDQDNGAMRVIPGTHTRQMRHAASQQDSDVLDMSTDRNEFNESEAVYLDLKAGQISLHDDNIVHGSGPNRSQRIRCGLTLRYSAGEVQCDTAVWPFFKAFWVRGVDRWGHNPMGDPPTDLMTEFTSVTPRTGQR